MCVDTIDGEKALTSVTEKIGQFFSKFDPQLAVQAMMSGTRWPRPEYTTREGVPFTEEEVLQTWTNTGLYARNRGTWMHYNIERYFNGLQTASDIPELRQFYRFTEDVIQNQSIEPFRTEWRIGAFEERMAGTIDFVGKCPDGTLAIFDWKRLKNFRGEFGNPFGRKARYVLVYPLRGC